MKYLLTKSILKIIFTLLVLTLLIINSNSCSQNKNDRKNILGKDTNLTHRQHMIHAKSPMVMPFDMDKVTHYFIKNGSGGILRIKTKKLNDTVQTSLIRSHLKKEYTLFSNADFKDPKTLHGMKMPGLKTLSESKGKFNVEYENLSDGAQIIFSSKESEVVKAIHKWFDAQIKDHGSDAKSKED